MVTAPAGRDVPRVVIAAPGSGHGKTSVATGLLAALRRRGLTVSPHKVGPDYIDPGYHALAAGRPGRNLDPWLVGEERIGAMFAHGASTPTVADIAVIEGVMGLFDGAGSQAASERDDFASTAHVARLLRAPVVLVVDASGVSSSAAALLHGFATFDPATRIGGVIFNQVGSDYHAHLLAAAAERVGVPVLGSIRRLDALAVPSRHLGLIPAAERGHDALAVVDALGAAVAAGVDLDAVLQLARTAGPLSVTEIQDLSPERTEASRSPVTIAVAGGPAFTFGYAEHPELLAAAGADVAVFDPLRDENLPDGAAGLVIGGGFPEVHAAQLSANAALRSQVAALARSGAPVLAECAGLLYLARSLDGRPMCGVLDIDAEMTGKLTLGYRDAVAVTGSALAPAGSRVHGHEFHRTAIRVPPEATATVQANAWRWQGRGAVVAEGFVQGGVHASYLHTHWNGVPGAAGRMVASARAYHAPALSPDARPPAGRPVGRAGRSAACSRYRLRSARPCRHDVIDISSIHIDRRLRGAGDARARLWRARRPGRPRRCGQGTRRAGRRAPWQPRGCAHRDPGPAGRAADARLRDADGTRPQDRRGVAAQPRFALPGAATA
jgi:cobyrinic acid a,c-diamide synthase